MPRQLLASPRRYQPEERTGFWVFFGGETCVSRSESMQPSPAVLAVSKPLLQRFRHSHGQARLLGRFHRAVDLWIDGMVVALVTPELGNGPFHLMISTLPDTPMPSAFPYQWAEGIVRFGPWTFQARGFAVWEPRFPWQTFSTRPERLAQLGSIVRAAAQRPTKSPFAAWLRGESFPVVSQLLGALREADFPTVRAAAGRLAGWGVGLTPSGDDFLAGVMLALWATGRASLNPALCEAAVPHTHRISRAFLRAARDGLADARWHRLLHALAGDEHAELVAAADDVLAFGASSGLDMLAGFYSVACQPRA